MKHKISLIVPCYNEQEVLPIFYKETCKVIEKMDADFEFVFIDDGSKDNTVLIMRELAEKDDRVFYYSFSRNFGKEAGIYAGLSNAKGDICVVMDADMQDPPSLLPQMYDAIINEGYDSVATCRETREGEPPVRSFFARLFYKIINKISDADIKDGARDFRMMSRKMVDSIIELGEYNRFSKGIFGWVGFKTKWLPYENIERAAGNTKWSFWKLFKYSLDGIVNFSSAPLYISSLIGILFCIIALISTIFFFVRRLMFGDPVTGWASTACIITFIGGVQLFCVGVLGQYMARMYLETKNRPKYIVRETNRKEEKD
ncbi:MAG: glycosyltransferase family 2 protein [Acutalibacteraceae bacterium]|nr:glycosyltransferase family 2 protein [Acutalibacteraceae bacterium]